MFRDYMTFRESTGSKLEYQNHVKVPKAYLMLSNLAAGRLAELIRLD